MILAQVVTVAWITLGGVLGAAIIGGPIMWALARFDRRNTEQHGVNVGKLQQLIDDVEQMQHDVRSARDESVACTRLIAEHTVEELSRYAAITMALGRLVGPQIIHQAERAVGIDQQEDPS